MQIERAGHFVRPFSHGRVGLLGDADVVHEPPREFAAGSVAREFDAGRSRRALGNKQQNSVEQNLNRR